MSEPILNIKQLNARVEEKEILHDINLQIHKGETHVLMGPNGAGKSTLGYVLMGNPKYQVTGGSILFKGKDVTEESADKRAKDGMFLSFQVTESRFFSVAIHLSGFLLCPKRIVRVAPASTARTPRTTRIRILPSSWGSRSYTLMQSPFPILMTNTPRRPQTQEVGTLI